MRGFLSLMVRYTISGVAIARSPSLTIRGWVSGMRLVLISLRCGRHLVIVLCLPRRTQPWYVRALNLHFGECIGLRVVPLEEE